MTAVKYIAALHTSVLGQGKLLWPDLIPFPVLQGECFSKIHAIDKKSHSLLDYLIVISDSALQSQKHLQKWKTPQDASAQLPERSTHPLAVCGQNGGTYVFLSHNSEFLLEANWKTEVGYRRM